MTSTVIYNGNLRTTCTHLKSADSFVTDAPTDNNGLGEAFSPTDTIATGLASCMITIMAIKANSMGIELKGTKAEVTKLMAASPRRISQINITLMLPKVPLESQKTLEKAGINCPVMHSLHPDIKKEINFKWVGI